jgi:hypothetical protein
MMQLRNTSKFILSRKHAVDDDESIVRPVVASVTKPAVRPEPLVDKQILRYLNFDA